MIEIKKEDLVYTPSYGENCGQVVDGYRIVFFYGDKYSVGPWAGEIEAFMFDFTKSDPIESDDDIPEFVSIDDLLTRYFYMLSDITAVGLYKTNGELIEIKHREDVNELIEKKW